MTRKMFVLLGVVTVVLAAATVGRATVLTPTGATASDYQDWGSGNRSPLDLLNADHFTTAGDVMTWALAGSDSAAGCWQTNNVTVNQQWVLFDLGTPHSISEAYLWSGSQWGLYNRDVNGFELWASDSGGDALSCLTATQGLVLQNSPANPSSTQKFDLVGANSEYVLLKVDSTWDGTTTDYVTLGKVRFEGGAPTPEPSAMALVTTGLFALLAYAWRKRR